MSINQRYGPYEGCYPIKPTTTRGEHGDRFATPFVVTDADRVAALDADDALDALERHLSTLERQRVTTDPIMGVVVERENGAPKSGPASGPVHAPTFRVGTDGKVYGRRGCGIVGSQTPNGYDLSVHPYVWGSPDSDILAAADPVRGGCLADYREHGAPYADLGAFGVRLAMAMDKRRTLITRPEQPDRFRLARTNGIDRLATAWARANGVELEPLVGSEYIGPHQVFSLDQATAVDDDGNVVAIADDVAVWRNTSQASDARALYGGYDVTRWNGSQLVTRDGYDVMNAVYGYDDVKYRTRGKVTTRIPSRQRVRMPSQTVLERHAVRLMLTAEPRRHPRTGEAMVTRTGKPRFVFYRDHGTHRSYVSGADTLITRTDVDGSETRDDAERVTHRTAARVAVKDGASSGWVRVDKSEPLTLAALKSERVRLAHTADEATTAARQYLATLAAGESADFGTLSVTRRKSDGRFAIKGSDTRYVTVMAAVHAVGKSVDLRVWASTYRPA